MGLLSAFRLRCTGPAASHRPDRSRRPHRRRPSAQTAFLTVESIDEDVVCLDGGRFRAVLEVAGVNFGLRGELDQEALVAGYAAFLNGLTFPIQILVRGLPIDVHVYLTELEHRARYDLPEQLAALARDHVLFLRRLARNRSLLERRFYVVVPAESTDLLVAAVRDGTSTGAPIPSRSWSRWWPFGARSGADSSGAAAAASAAAARKQLTFRCEEVQRQLARCGLAVHRLTSTELAQLSYACWCPELARIQRLRGHLDDFTSLVVGAATTATTAPARAPQRPAPTTASDAAAPAPAAAPSAGAAGPAAPDRSSDADERRFALGTRTVADLLAPAAIEVGRTHVRLDHQYARTLVVTGYPRTVSAGWLAPLIDFEEPIELSLHVHPLETGPTVRLLNHRLVQLHSSRLLDARGGRLADPEREVAYEDVERLRDALQRGDEKVFSVSLYLLLRAGTPAALDDLTRRVEATLDAMLAHSRVAVLEQDGGFRSCLPEGHDHLLVYRNLDTSSLATTFPFCSSSLSMDRGVLYGIATHNHSPVIIDPFDPSLENANTAIVATSGAGKSYFTKLMALRTLLTGVDFIVIDPEDEYRGLCAAVGGQRVHIAGTSSQHLNPFDLPAGDGAIGAAGAAGAVGEVAGASAPGGPGEEGDALAEQVASLLGLLEVMLASPDEPLTTRERAVLDRALYQTYAGAGITADVATHGRAAPLLRDLYAALVALSGAAAAGDGSPGGRAPMGSTGSRGSRGGMASADGVAGVADVAAHLAMRLRRYVEGSLGGLFSAPTNVALSDHFVVFDLQALEPELQPLAIHMITSFVWQQVRRHRRPRLLVVDEAWSLLQYPEGGRFLASMARRARKYGLGLVTISQQIADFLAAEHGRTVLANAAIKLLMKHDAASAGLVTEAFELSVDERQLLLAAGKGEGLLLARGDRIALKVEASPLEHRLATTAPQEWGAAGPQMLGGPASPSGGASSTPAPPAAAGPAVPPLPEGASGAPPRRRLVRPPGPDRRSESPSEPVPVLPVDPASVATALPLEEVLS